MAATKFNLGVRRLATVFYRSEAFGRAQRKLVCERTVPSPGFSLATKASGLGQPVLAAAVGLKALAPRAAPPRDTARITPHPDSALLTLSLTPLLPRLFPGFLPRLLLRSTSLFPIIRNGHVEDPFRHSRWAFALISDDERQRALYEARSSMSSGKMARMAGAGNGLRSDGWDPLGEPPSGLSVVIEVDQDGFPRQL
jgi:hypothetical protein